MNNIEKIYEDLCKYKPITYEENVKKRLNKTLNNYISQLDETCDRIKDQDKKLVVKELSK